MRDGVRDGVSGAGRERERSGCIMVSGSRAYIVQNWISK